MNKKNALIGTMVLLVLTGIGWAMYRAEDPDLVELEQLRDEQFAKRHDLTNEQHEANRQVFGEKMKDLSEDQRRAFFEKSAPIFMKMMEARLDQFLAMSPEEKRAELDKRIDESLAREKNQQANGGPGGPPGAGGGQGRTPPTPQQIDAFRKKMLDRTTPEQRAKFQMTMQMYNNRMKERGLPPKQGGGRFF